MMDQKITKEVYEKQADKLGESSLSTMPDEIVRQREEELILAAVSFLSKKKKLKILDLGCGNGYILDLLSQKFPQNKYWGIDYTEKMIEVCNRRGLENCEFQQGDARFLNFPTNYFDFVFTERCLTNILDSNEQEKALSEVHRILKNKGHYLFIECFTDGLDNTNKARDEFGLQALAPVKHNLYFEKLRFLQFVSDKFLVLPSGFKLDDYSFHQNFLSSHYFIARVLHPLLEKGPTVRNSQFVKFFSFLPPIGNYSQIQAFLLKKK